MDLPRHLRFFVAVAEQRHFGRAASSLGMTQPPLSQGVQRLERHLGVQLFDRKSRGVRITDAGLALLPQARALLVAEACLLQQAAAHTTDTTLRVGLVSDAEEQAVDLVDALTRTGFHVSPRMGGSIELTDLLRGGDLDVALVRHPGVVDGTRPRNVHQTNTRIVTPQDHGRNNPLPLRISDTALPVAVPPRRHHPAAHDQFVDSLRRLGHSGTTLEHPDPLTRSSLVAAGLAVRLTTHRTAGRALTGDPLPLRLRVLLPIPSHRRSGLDSERAAAALETALG